MNNKTKMRLWLIAITLVTATHVTATQTQDIRKIKKAVKAFILKQPQQYTEIKVNVDGLDNRLKLHACNHKVQVFFPYESKVSDRTTVGVRCRQPKPWTIFVSAHVSTYAIALIASRPLAANKAIEPADFIAERRLIRMSHLGFFTDPKDIIGKRPKRPINAGVLLRPNSLKAEQLIRRGDRVSIQTGTSNLEVQMTGIAMNNGTQGERIDVRNLLTKRIIQGEVIRKGVVTVN